MSRQLTKSPNPRTQPARPRHPGVTETLLVLLGALMASPIAQAQSWTFHGPIVAGGQLDAVRGPNDRIHVVSTRYYQIDAGGAVLVDEPVGDAQQCGLCFPPALAAGDDGTVHLLTRHAGDMNGGYDLRYRRRSPSGTWDADFLVGSRVKRNYVVGVAWAGPGQVYLLTSEAGSDVWGDLHIWQAGSGSATRLGSLSGIWRADADARLRGTAGHVFLVSCKPDGGHGGGPLRSGCQCQQGGGPGAPRHPELPWLVAGLWLLGAALRRRAAPSQIPRDRRTSARALALGAALAAALAAACGPAGPGSPDGATRPDAGDGGGPADGGRDATPRPDGGDGGAGCGSLVCPSGFLCEDGLCHDGVVVLVPYDLAALRTDGALEVHVAFTPTGGAPRELPVRTYHPRLPAAEVLWQGPGAGTYASVVRDDDPWWTHRALNLSRSRDLADVQAEGSAASVMSQAYQDMGWGLWMDAVGASSPAQIARRQAFLDAGLPVFGYLEGTGNLFVFLAAIDDPPVKMPGTDVTRLRYTHWNWGSWGGSLPAGLQAIWMGMHTFYNAPSYAEPWTANHPVYGDPVAPTYPDGSPAVPLPGADADPRLEGLYRACAALDINGDVALDLSLQGGRDVTGLPGVVPIDGRDYSILGLARDPACPVWLRQHERSLRYAVDQGTQGCWMDNVSLWDAFGLVPVSHGFGAHLHAGFEAFLLAHASSAFLDRSGLTIHLGAMSMRCIVKWKARTGFGDDPGSAGLCANPIDPGHPGLGDPRWDADLSWGAYLAHTADAHATYYEGIRQILEGLDPDFLWGANDLPGFGGPVAARVPPAMNLSELSLGTHYLKGVTGPPPERSLAPLYHLAGAFDRAQFQSVWLYVDLPGHADSAALHRTLAAEALAYDTFLMPAADDARAPGTTASAGAINAWLVPLARDLEGRADWCEAGIVYASDAWLRTFRPAGLPTTDIPDPDGPGTRTIPALTHLHAFAGWHDALRRAHHQGCPLLAERLTPGDLDPYPVVVLPHLTVLSRTLRDNVLLPWVQAGGTLVITGRTGRYQGWDALYEPWSPVEDGAPPVGADPLTGLGDLDGVTSPTTVSVGSGRVVVVPGTPGADAWLGRGTASIDSHVATLAGAGSLPARVLEPPAGAAADVRLHVDRARGRLYVDLVNRGWDAASDTLPTAGPQTVTVALPPWLWDADLAIRSAGGHGTVTGTVDNAGHSVTLTVDDLPDLVTAIVELR